MRVTAFESLPPFAASHTLDQVLGDLEVVTSGEHCLIRKSDFLALCSLETGKVIWCATREVQVGSNDPTRDDFADLMLWGAKLWIGSKDQVVAEISYDDSDSVKLVARCLKTGDVLWDYVHPRPPLATWAEPMPAWPGAPQEEIYVFLARSDNNLVLCLHRRTRCVGMSTPEFTVFDKPSFQCQTDLVSFEPTTGAIRWSKSQVGLRLNILEWKNFLGLWVNDHQAGWLDLRSGVESVLEKEGSHFGMPTHYEGLSYFPWFDSKSKSVGYLQTNQLMEVAAEFSWNEKGVRDTRVWPTSRGVAMQVNDQKVIWTTAADRLWEQRCKPYVYQVFATDDSDIFVATDGGGGRLIGFDRSTGHETYNFRPALGGMGHTHFFKEARIVVAIAAMKKSNWVPPKLLVFKIDDKSMEFASSCWAILSQWSRGVVFVDGEEERRISFLDLGT